jgi:hypothetical protein
MFLFVIVRATEARVFQTYWSVNDCKDETDKSSNNGPENVPNSIYLLIVKCLSNTIRRQLFCSCLVSSCFLTRTGHTHPTHAKSQLLTHNIDTLLLVLSSPSITNLRFDSHPLHQVAHDRFDNHAQNRTKVCYLSTESERDVSPTRTIDPQDRTNKWNACTTRRWCSDTRTRHECK